MNQRLRKSTAIITALFVLALVIVSFFHVGHSHDKDHSCSICSFHKLSQTAVVSTTVLTDFVVTVDPAPLTGIPRLAAGDASIHGARAPPQA